MGSKPHLNVKHHFNGGNSISSSIWKLFLVIFVTISIIGIQSCNGKTSKDSDLLYDDLTKSNSTKSSHLSASIQVGSTQNEHNNNDDVDSIDIDDELLNQKFVGKNVEIQHDDIDDTNDSSDENGRQEITEEEEQQQPSSLSNWFTRNVNRVRRSLGKFFFMGDEPSEFVEEGTVKPKKKKEKLNGEKRKRKEKGNGVGKLKKTTPFPVTSKYGKEYRTILSSTTEGIRPKRQNYHDWDLEGSGIDGVESIKNYRITFLASEFWQPKYLDRESEEFEKLAKQIENAISEYDDNRNIIQKIEVMEISQTDDAFKLYVTVDVQIQGDQHSVEDFKDELQSSINNFMIGSLSVDGKHFSFNELPEDSDLIASIPLRRVKNITVEPFEFINVTACTEPGLFNCKTRQLCVLQSEVCDGKEHCLDGSDEENCDEHEIGYDSSTPYLTAGTPSGDGEFTPSIYDRITPSYNGENEVVSRCDEIFICKISGVEICDIQRCDGHPDCPNREDETDCQVTVCNEDQFRCDYDVCLPMSVRCNNIFDCLDRTDETNCAEIQECHESQYQCRSGACIQNSQLCDRIPDCPNGEDEQDCPPIQCRPDEFKCVNDTECIRESSRCDGIPDCIDSSDEKECTSCKPDTFHCQSSRECLQYKYRCDRRLDCIDGSDEFGCERCRPSEFECGDGTCLSQEKRCDGVPQCTDQSDELDCEYGCRPDQFKCNDNTCVDRSSQCDGRQDCPDGSDEVNCGPAPSRCQPYQWSCSNGQCINAYARCDGRSDCADSSDEIGCPINSEDEKKGCGPNSFGCENGPCIPNELRCNGQVDCPYDGSDELDCEIINNEITPTRPPSDPQLNLKTYPSNQIIKESREVVFRCRDEGPSRSRVKWTRPGGRPLPPGFSDKNGRLEIPNIRVEDAGEYVCEAVGYPSFTPGQRVTVHLTVEKYNPLLEIPSQACGYHEATCMNGECISKQSICDGIPHCSDGSDEHSCSYGRKCSPNQFNCKNGKCVDRTWRCDGENDCGDNSDEESCDPAPSSSPCRYDEFQCKSGHCIPKSFHCDRTNDCIDGSDEHGCMSPVVIQPPPPRVVLPLGGVLNITCRATGVPTPLIIWRRNWGHVPDKCSSTTSGGFGELYCTDMQHQDSGAYSCEVINTIGKIFVVPDTIVIIETDEGVCPAGFFNVEAVQRDQCINCFCFGVSTECKSADLFIYHMPPPASPRKVALVSIPPYGDIRVNDYSGSELINLGHGIQFRASNVPFSQHEVPYLELPSEFHGNQLKSYGGSLKYEAQFIGRGRSITAPDVILIGNGYALTYHHPQEMEPNVRNPVKAQFLPGSWKKHDGRQATREEIMMTLAGVEYILIRLQYIDVTERQVEITHIIMDSAVADDKGLGSASLVEQCTCPPGYSGFSCESCAPGYGRQSGAPWLGRCVPEQPQSCPSGTYGDPSRNIPCRTCPCPLTNPENNFARECSLGQNNDAICYCLPGYTGRRCEKCEAGYEGNPMMPGGSCRPISYPRCDPMGTLSVRSDGSCVCKDAVTGGYCDMCKPGAFNLNNFTVTGCTECFCMGVTKQCTSSTWHRDTIQSSFGGGRPQSGFKVISNYEDVIESDVRIFESNNELQLQTRPGDELYWSLPDKFLGDKIASYGGSLNYTIRFVPQPGGVMSRNNAPDVVIKSLNNVVLLHYRTSQVSPSTTQSYSVPIIESYWQRIDGTPFNREHLLMALADVEHIFIKATYTTVTQEAALSHVSLDAAVETNIGTHRAVEVEQCACPPGYLGLSCEDCAPGFTRDDESGLYLGLCEPCNCNGHSTECDSNTGVCYNCRDNTEGDHCERCAYGYEGDATSGSPLSCRPSGSYPSTTCEYCNPDGTSDCVNNECVCKKNVEGSTCNQCRPGTFNLQGTNRDGCSECYCSGVTSACTSGPYTRIEKPVDFFGDDFTLNNYDGSVVYDSGIDKNVENSVVSYMQPLYRTLFWSLPQSLLGNQVKSYGGNLQFTVQTGRYESFQPDQDVIIIGNNKKLIWTRPKELESSEMVTVRLHEDSGWELENGRPAGRQDILTVLSNIQNILIRANPQGPEAPYSQIRDITLETAVRKSDAGAKAITEVEECYCSSEFEGSSCERCAVLHYRNVTQRVGDFGACLKCPCNEINTETCSMNYVGRVECHCKAGYAGDRCDIPVTERPIPAPIQTPSPVTISVTVSTPEILIVDIGESVVLECSGEVVSTRQPITVFWYRLDTDLPETAVLEGGRLHLQNLQIHDSGVYVCQAKRDHELVEKKVSVTVGKQPSSSNPTRPRIVINPPYLEIEEYRSGEAHCIVSGYPQPYVTWSRADGRPLPTYVIADQELLRFSSAQKSDEGSYRCTAQNNIGIETAIIEVYIIQSDNRPIEPTQPPYPSHDIYIEPSSVNVIEGDPVRLICNVGARERAEYGWLKDNQELYANPNVDIRENVLTIGSSYPTDSGVYTCTAYIQRTQTSYSTTAYVTVERRSGGGGGGGGESDQSPRIRPLRRQHTIAQGEDFSITCETEGGVYPTITWTKLHMPMDSNTEQTAGTLRIINARPDNRGVYLCIAETPAGTDQAEITVDVEPREYPKIEIHPNATSYYSVGERVQLTCQSLGIPTPRITWQRIDRRPISSRAQVNQYGSYTILSFDGISHEDAGEYECSAENIAGHVSGSTTILVTEPPRIMLNPEKEQLTLTEGDELRIICQSTGIPTPTVKWEIPKQKTYALAGFPRLPQSTSQQLGEALLEVYRITTNDKGIYTCTANNSIAKDVKHIMVDVIRRRGDTGISDVDYPTQQPPYHPQSPYYPPHVYTADIGDNSTLSCHIEGGEYGQPKRTTWTRVDGRPLPRDSYFHNSDLIIPVISADAIGIYQCSLLENGVLRPLIQAEIILIPIPRITFAPAMPMIVRPGENVDILCNVTGEQPIQMEWVTENKRPLPPSVIVDRQFLRFHAITPSDAGRYFCIASNRHGNVTKVAEVLVNLEQVSKPSTETTHEIYEGHGVELSCDVPQRRTSDNIRFVWEKENGVISHYARYNGSRLIIPVVQRSDEGRYICKVIQPGEIISQNYVDLYVKTNIHPPALQIKPERAFLFVGERIIVDCYSNSGDPVNVTWHRADGRPFPPNIKQSENQLIIMNAQESDSGEYICRCSSDKGSFYSDAFELDIQEESRHTRKPKIEYVEIGKSVKLTCDVDEFPATFQWTRQFGEIQSEKDRNNSELRLDNVKSKDAGTYICTVNHNGLSKETPIILIVTGAIPHFTQAPLSYIQYNDYNGSAGVRFNVEITFKPERSNGQNGLLFSIGTNTKSNFFSISLNDGHIESRYKSLNSSKIIRSDRTITMGQWHTVRIFRYRKEAIMQIDDHPPIAFNDVEPPFGKGSELDGEVYLGGHPNIDKLSNDVVAHKTGFVGCVSYMVLQEIIIELNDNIRRVGVTSCEPCAEEPCKNDGICLESQTEMGYTCVCQRGYSGRNCTVIGNTCTPGVCGSGICENGEHGIECYCPLNKTGDRCQYVQRIDDTSLRLDGKSYAAYKHPSLGKINVTFFIRPTNLEQNNNSLLLYTGESEHVVGDYAAALLRNGHIIAIFKYGERIKPAIVRSPYPIKENEWTSINIARKSGQNYLLVGSQPIVIEPPIKAKYQRPLSLKTLLYIGGIEKNIHVHDRLKGVHGFHGCISNLIVNYDSINLVSGAVKAANILNCGFSNEVAPPPLIKPTDPCLSEPCTNHGTCITSPNKMDYQCLCPILFGGKICEKSIDLSTNAHFSTNSYLELDNSTLANDEPQNSFFVMVFSTNDPNGLLLWQGQGSNEKLTNKHDYLAAALVNGQIEFVFRLNGKNITLKTNEKYGTFHNGKPHIIVAKRSGYDATLETDKKMIYTQEDSILTPLDEPNLNAHGPVFIGGAPNIHEFTGGRYQKGFNGCIHILENVDGAINLKQRANSAINVEECSKDELNTESPLS